MKEYEQELDNNSKQAIETIFSLATCPQNHSLVVIQPDRKQGVKKAQTLMDKYTFYTDGSDRNGQSRSAVITKIGNQIAMEKKVYIGTHATTNSYAAELYGILLAVQRISQIPRPQRQNQTHTIAVDSQNVLRSLIAPSLQSGQSIIIDILAEVKKLQTSSTHISNTNGSLYSKASKATS